MVRRVVTMARPSSSGQHTVEGDQIVITTHGADQAFAAVVHPINVQSMATQLGDDLAGRYGVILDGQNAGHRITW